MTLPRQPDGQRQRPSWMDRMSNERFYPFILNILYVPVRRCFVGLVRQRGRLMLTADERRSTRIHLCLSVFICGCSCLSGCGGIKPGRTPRDTFDAARRAVMEENYEAFWQLLSGRERDAEALRFAAEKQRMEVGLEQLTPDEKEEFRKRNGISPEEYVGLSPRSIFARDMGGDARLMDEARRALAGARVVGVRSEGNRARLSVQIPDERPVEVELVLDHGLWRIPDAEGFFEALGFFRRARGAGRTPEETLRAAGLCLASGAEGDLWELFTPGGAEPLAEIVRADQEAARKLTRAESRIFERNAGISAEAFAHLETKDAFALELRTGHGRLSVLRSIFLGRFVSADIVGDRGVINVKTITGSVVKLQVELRGGRWYFGRLR